MKRKTAVECFEKVFYTYAESTGINNNKWLIEEEDLDRLIKQAKEMEKEQIIDSVDETISEMSIYNSSMTYENGEQYYKEKYKP
jgi:hypothetical protein